jgi:hypothetical protein
MPATRRVFSPVMHCTRIALTTSAGLPQCGQQPIGLQLVQVELSL